MTLRIVTDEGDPAEIEQRERVKETLRDLIERVDELNLTELVFVASGKERTYAGRLLNGMPYGLIGLLEYEKAALLGVIDEQLSSDEE